MNIEEYREFCLSFDGVTEGFPFDEKVLVFKVMGKMFALTDIEEFEGINLKCEPERAVMLREEFEEIKPGYHMNKVHWNTVSVTGSLDDQFIRQLITESYNLIVAKLPKKEKEKLEAMK
ncbi:MAG: MmcQ/YjbR family DNA-binding protein [Balneola sp.]|nr:MAG: MmcQ/YjbR family DNA-binding protein [Balneola sp.]